MSEPKKEFYLVFSEKSHKTTIKYHPNVGFVYQVRFYNEKGEMIDSYETYFEGPFKLII